jgi:hypothetical protein
MTRHAYIWGREAYLIEECPMFQNNGDVPIKWLILKKKEKNSLPN